MSAVQREVLRHEVAVPDEVVLFEGDRSEVAVDGAQDRGQPAAPLRTGRVVDHVDGDEIVEIAIVACLLAPEHLLDDLPRPSSCHAGGHPGYASTQKFSPRSASSLPSCSRWISRTRAGVIASAGSTSSIWRLGLVPAGCSHASRARSSYGQMNACRLDTW